ncbi:hypothetical protein C173_00547 [Paenibacillus sp. FSL R7-277]|uniref:hypothetical protein n=1 Tax=Paenibacillus sp. FSL R7-277 TaxID=1227352 RepID=UPI0003E26E5C|nr:hypothetical protein [Paenibacillus sp. FSL R7-277]ETT79602.1 hypothetical protein C173_00547 [Paenibacillus sp. FSL R7-277]
MNYRNEDSNSSAHPSGYRHLPQPYPYSHYHYLVRSESTEETAPRIAKNSATAGNTQTVRASEPPAAPHKLENDHAEDNMDGWQQIQNASKPQTVLESGHPAAANKSVDGHPGASQAGGKGIHVDVGGELGGKHGIGINAGGNLAYSGASMQADGHIGSSSYGIEAQGDTHVSNGQGLGVNAEAQAFGKYGVAAQGKAQLGGGQGADVKLGAQAGGDHGLNADAGAHLGLSQGAGFDSHVQLGGNKGIGAEAKAQFGGGEGAGIGVGGQLGKYNGQLSFKIGGKEQEPKDSQED